MVIKTKDLKIIRSQISSLSYSYHPNVIMKGIKFWLSFSNGDEPKPYFASLDEDLHGRKVPFKTNIFHAFNDGVCPLCFNYRRDYCTYFSRGRRRVTFLKELYKMSHEENKLRMLIRGFDI